jgi:hypothetical protein
MWQGYRAEDDAGTSGTTVVLEKVAPWLSSSTLIAGACWAAGFLSSNRVDSSSILFDFLVVCSCLLL